MNMLRFNRRWDKFSKSCDNCIFNVPLHLLFHVYPTHLKRTHRAAPGPHRTAEPGEGCYMKSAEGHIDHRAPSAGKYCARILPSGKEGSRRVTKCVTTKYYDYVRPFQLWWAIPDTLVTGHEMTQSKDVTWPGNINIYVLKGLALAQTQNKSPK